MKKNPYLWELSRIPRHGGGKLDTFSGCSKLNYITNLMARQGEYLPMGGE